MKIRFEAELWPWREGSWCFVTVPPDHSEAIRSVPRPPRRGFGSLRVGVTVGTATWATSIFPDSDSGCFVLPIKKAVRAAESLELGDTARVELEVFD